MTSEVDMQTKDVKNGYMLFRHEFEKGKEGLNFHEKVRESTKAWRNMSEEERKKYNDRAKQGRPDKQKRNYPVAFHSRCSLNQFTKLAAHVNCNPHLKAKVQRLGFGALLDVECMRLPREILVAIMRAYDPPTNQFRIRGKTAEIEAKDVAEFLGVPNSGDEVRVDISDTDDTYKRLKAEYGKVKYENILSDITSGEADDKFEFLFMLHTLGTFLAPTASSTISDKLLKLMCYTMKGFANFDWATYIVNDLRKEMADYIDTIRVNKEGSCNVGGCLYMLLIFFGERFPLSKPVCHASTSAIKFWTKEKVKEMIDKERKSDIGLLYMREPTKVHEQKDFPNKKGVAYLDPELKALHARLMGVIEDNHRKLVAAVEDELVKAQLQIESRRKQQAEDPIDCDEINDDNPDRHEGSDRVHGEDDEGQDHNEDGVDHDADDNVDTSLASPINICEFDEETPNQEPTNIDQEQSGDDEVGQKEQGPRRSKRPRMPKNMSPWTLTKPVKRTKRAKDDKDKFFEVISRITNAAEGEEVLVDIGDEYTTRDQLWTLGGLNKISNRLMSLVCKMLMAEMKSAGQVGRHIFDADFMLLLARKPIGWSVAEWEDQLLPEQVGYNIAECDLILGPMLVAEHWFCVALEPKTMNFYVLDSMRPLTFTSKSKQRKKQSAFANPQESALNILRDRFHAIIALVKPGHAGKKPVGDFIWAPIPQQNNLRDCGVHVLIWLNNWKPGVTFDYGADEVGAYRRDLMWWVVNHEMNRKREDALRLLAA